MNEEYLSGLVSDTNGNTAISLSGGFNIPVPTGPGVPDGLSVQPMRHRRSGLEQGLLMAKDVFDSISGVDPNAYLGKTAQLANQYDKVRMEEDPEGHQIDLNRAKILSQRAYATNDPETKKKYGAAIKRLLPRETQGLDDLTASEFLISSEKMEIEKLKAATKLKQEELKGTYGLQKQELSNQGKVTIQDMKNAATQEHDALQYSLKMALADKDYEKAVMIRDRMDALEQFKKEADYARSEMQEQYRLEGKQYTADKGYQRAVDVANINANSREGVARINAQSREAVANINALSRQQAAQLKANAAATASGTNELGDIIPSQGVVDAITLIENNPGQFDEFANWADTSVGRFFGLLSEKGVKNRSEATMALQETVTGSVMNLMKLFPKGGASVINSGTEQKRFAPIAEIIASGRGNKIVPAVKSYYGGLYDAAQKVAGEKAPITREEYVNLMVYGNTKGKGGGGLSMISRDVMGMSSEGLPTVKRTQTSEGGVSASQSQYKKEGKRVF